MNPGEYQKYEAQIKEEGRNRILKAQQEKADRKAAGVDEEGEKKERESEKKHSAKSQVENIKRQIAEIDKKIASGKETVTPMSFSFGGGAAPITSTMSVTKINQLKLQRYNLEKKLRELE